MQMKSVFSSHINAIGYDSGNLQVEFKNGMVAVYQDVPEDVANNVLNAPSVGTALNALVKGKYAFGYANNG